MFHQNILPVTTERYIFWKINQQINLFYFQTYPFLSIGRYIIIILWISSSFVCETNFLKINMHKQNLKIVFHLLFSFLFFVGKTYSTNFIWKRKWVQNIRYYIMYIEIQKLILYHTYIMLNCIFFFKNWNVYTYLP